MVDKDRPVRSPGGWARHGEPFIIPPFLPFNVREKKEKKVKEKKEKEGRNSAAKKSGSPAGGERI